VATGPGAGGASAATGVAGDVPSRDAAAVEVAETAASDAPDVAGGEVTDAADDTASEPHDTPAPSAPQDASRANHRRHGRRARRRHDPLDGDELPDVPMPPVDASADFERVRVVAEDAPDVPAAAAPPAEAATTPAAAAPVPVTDAGSRRGRTSAPAATRAEPAPAAATSAESTEPSGPGATGDTPASDDAVSGIFARLRAEADKRPEVDDKPGTDTSGAAETAATGDDGEDAPSGRRAGGEATGATAEPPAPQAEAQPEGALDAEAERLAAVFERRDAAVDEVARRLAKHLKRQLSDQQSALLDELRRHRGSPSVDDVLGPPEAFAADWVGVIRDDLAGAVASGVALAGDLDPTASDHGDVDVTAATEELIDSIAEPLRARLVVALGEGAVDDDEDDQVAAIDDLELADRIRACYREWRGARHAAAVADACARAFGLGIRAAIPAATGLVWYCGPGDAPCSDCNDNQLEGPVAVGDAFPTGQAVAPAHPGCRCLALPELL
jgi:hypothetical protein